jgi:hypothetical protein
LRHFLDHLKKNYSNRGRFYHNYQPQVKTKNLHDIPNKKISTVIYNLRSGYAKLNDYCHKLNITESANCQCGERETVEHYPFRSETSSSAPTVRSTSRLRCIEPDNKKHVMN